MTLKELIEILSKIENKDAYVYTRDYDGTEYALTGDIYVYEDERVVISAW